MDVTHAIDGSRERCDGPVLEAARHALLVRLLISDGQTLTRTARTRGRADPPPGGRDRGLVVDLTVAVGPLGVVRGRTDGSIPELL